MKYTREKFDNSGQAIKGIKEEHEEAKEFVWGYLQDKGLTESGCGLDFDDIFDVMRQYKGCLSFHEIGNPETIIKRPKISPITHERQSKSKFRILEIVSDYGSTFMPQKRFLWFWFDLIMNPLWSKDEAKKHIHSLGFKSYTKVHEL